MNGCILTLASARDEARLQAMIAEHEAALAEIATRNHLPGQRGGAS